MTWHATADDVIDSRDLIEWIEDEDNAKDDPKTAAEIQEIREDGYADFEYGETLIRADYFETWTEEFANDIGAVPESADWPLRHIDWSAAARELAFDYSSVTLLGTDYFIRS